MPMLGWVWGGVWEWGGVFFLLFNQAIEDTFEGELSVANNFFVSNPGMESITFILHGATSLPPLSDGGVPQPFAIL